MKPCRWLFILMALLLTAGIYVPALADWIPVENGVIIIEQDPEPDGEFVKAKVTLENTSGAVIEGKLRLWFNINESAPALFPEPYNAEKAGEDGNDPTPYYEIVTGQAEIFDVDEVAFVEIQFEAAALEGLEGYDSTQLLGYYDLPPAMVFAELEKRFGLSGLDEKASRTQGD